MKCGAYDASKCPNKTEFKGSAEREVSDSGVKEFFDELGETDSSQRQWVFKLVDRATGKYKNGAFCCPSSSNLLENKDFFTRYIVGYIVFLNFLCNRFVIILMFNTLNEENYFNFNI